MASRLLLGSLGAFWLLMTVLLWRSEYADSKLSRTPVDAGLVWERILTSPDSSSLAILQQDQRLGFCHLITGVADSLNQGDPTNAPAGMVRNIRHYILDINGSLSREGDEGHIRFDGKLTLSHDQEWEALQLQIIARPLSINVSSKRSDGILHLRVDGPDLSADRSIRLADLSQPEFLVAELFGPSTWMGLPTLPLFQSDQGLGATISALRWTACTDRMMLGSSSSQIYRLQLNPMEGVEVVILVSRAGEILRVSLPWDIQLVNEALAAP